MLFGIPGGAYSESSHSLEVRGQLAGIVVLPFSLVTEDIVDIPAQGQDVLYTQNLKPLSDRFYLQPGVANVGKMGHNLQSQLFLYGPRHIHGPVRGRAGGGIGYGDKIRL